MVQSDTRLFHLHYHVTDVERAERVLADVGLPPNRRYGRVDGEAVALDPDEPTPAGFRLRLQDSQRGHVNVTIAPAPARRFDHLGVVTADVETVVGRAESRDGWSTHDRDGRRTFLATPWGFRVELQPADGDVANGLGRWETVRFETVVLAVPVDVVDQVREGLREVLGPVSGLDVASGAPEHVDVPTARLAGEAFPDERTLEAARFDDVGGGA